MFSGGFVTWLLVSLVTIVPMIKLLPFFGIDRRWAFACFFPLATVILLWVMALKLQDLEKL